MHPVHTQTVLFWQIVFRILQISCYIFTYADSWIFFTNHNVLHRYGCGSCFAHLVVGCCRFYCANKTLATSLKEVYSLLNELQLAKLSQSKY